MLNSLTATALRLNAAANEARNVESVTISIERIDLQDLGAIAYVCAVDGAVLVLPTSTGDEVLDDGVASSKLIYGVHHDPDGAWRINQSVVTEEASGSENNLCG